MDESQDLSLFGLIPSLLSSSLFIQFSGCIPNELRSNSFGAFFFVLKASFLHMNSDSVIMVLYHTLCIDGGDSVRHVIRGLRTFILHGVFDSLNRSSKQNEYGKVYLPKPILIIGIVISTVLLIPALALLFSEDAIIETICFFAFSLLGDVLIVAYVNCRIFYDDEGFIHKSFWGIRRRFNYDQVTAIKDDTHERYLYVGRKRIMVDEFAVGGDEFISFVKKKYRTLNNGQTMPRINRDKHDIFKGNVNSAGQFIFAYTLVSVIMTGLLIVVICYTYFTPKSESNTEEHTVSFVTCEKVSGDIILTSADNHIYKIRFADELIDINTILSICNGKSLTVYSTEITPDKEENYFSVRAIEYKGEHILSFDETNRMHQKGNTPGVIYIALLWFVSVAYIALSIYVGRNPRKFSRRFVRLFFKAGYVSRSRK